jgi:hypothetical protein
VGTGGEKTAEERKQKHGPHLSSTGSISTFLTTTAGGTVAATAGAAVTSGALSAAVVVVEAVDGAVAVTGTNEAAWGLKESFIFHEISLQPPLWESVQPAMSQNHVQ